ncbi:unnamed protein product [Prunus brigantina]
MVAVALVKVVDVKGGVWGEFVGIGGLWPVERDRFRRSSSCSSISEGLEGFVPQAFDPKEEQSVYGPFLRNHRLDEIVLYTMLAIGQYEIHPIQTAGALSCMVRLYSEM